MFYHKCISRKAAKVAFAKASAADKSKGAKSNPFAPLQLCMKLYTYFVFPGVATT